MRDSAQPMFIAWGPEKRLLYNDAYAALMGDKHPGAFGQPLLEVWPELIDDLAPITERANDGQAVHMEDFSLRLERNGQEEEAHFAFSYTPIRDEKDQVLGFFCACLETTELVAAQRLREYGLRRMEQVFEQTPGFIAHMVGPDHVFNIANAAFRRLVGEDRDLIGKPVAEALPEAAEQGLVAMLDKVFTTGQAVVANERSVELRRGPGGALEERIVDFAYHPIFLDNGEITGIYCQGIDVTERHQATEDLRRLNETLEQRVAEELASREQVEDALRQSQKMEAIGQLTGGMAHDFNNLLTVIRSSADMLRRLELPEPKRRRYLDAIAETADRAAKLTSQLLAFARRQALRPTVFNVTEHVRSIVDMLHTVVGARVHLVCDLECEDCFVEADAVQFETALVNLAVNARDAMDGEGRLTLTVRTAEEVPSVRGHGSAPGRFVSVAIADTGCGIPVDQIGHIFEPFFTTKEVGKGTGLGLSQVYGFGKQSGGEVDVQSIAGQGATFTLYLPRVDAPEGERSHAVDADIAGEAHGHVLIVEDNEEVGSFSTELLSDLGYQTSRAVNADAALKLLEAAPGAYSVVFSDVVMPGMSGVELAKEISRRWPDLPVVLTSGYSHVLAQEGSHGFELLNKPWSLEDLQRVLRTAGR